MVDGVFNCEDSHQHGSMLEVTASFDSDVYPHATCDTGTLVCENGSWFTEGGKSVTTEEPVKCTDTATVELSSDSYGVVLISHLGELYRVCSYDNSLDPDKATPDQLEDALSHIGQELCGMAEGSYGGAIRFLSKQEIQELGNLADPPEPFARVVSAFGAAWDWFEGV